MIDFIRNMAKISILNGPNLNMLGIREPGHYGNSTLSDIQASLSAIAVKHQHQLEFFQSNSEKELIENIHQSYQTIDFIIINPAAFTHTSIAIRDALSAVNIPFIELHLSNVYARESFRHISYFSDIAQGVITGLGVKGYELALEYAMHHVSTTHNRTS